MMYMASHRGIQCPMDGHFHGWRWPIDKMFPGYHLADRLVKSQAWDCRMNCTCSGAFFLEPSNNQENQPPRRRPTNSMTMMRLVGGTSRERYRYRMYGYNHTGSSYSAAQYFVLRTEYILAGEHPISVQASLLFPYLGLRVVPYGLPVI